MTLATSFWIRSSSPSTQLAKPPVPTIRSLRSIGDTVIALFDGEAIAVDGKPYRNLYVWLMQMRDGKVIHTIAFLDAIAFDEFWKRVESRLTR